MITPDNFRQFVRSIHQSVIKAPSPPADFKLARVRTEVAQSLQFPKSEDQRRRRLERCPIPFNSRLCAQISGHFARLGISLPIYSWQWPLPAGMSLTANERLAIWQEAVEHARQNSSIDTVWLETHVSIEPYIKPAGDGRWFLCNRSPVPFKLCALVLGAERVTQRLADNSIADETHTRREEDQAFHKALVASWKGERTNAFTLFKRSADAGHAQAAFNVACMLEEGDGVKQDLTEAVNQYQIAAARGSAIAHHNLGGIYLHGNEIVEKDIQQAIAHFEIGERLGVAASAGCLGSIYLHGNGVPVNRDKAIGHLKRGAENGDDHSMNAWATVIDELNGGVSTPESFALYRKAARNAKQWNHALPMFNLGLCYMHGNGVAKNLRTARRLFRIAANAGDPDAALNLGYLHLKGMGTPVDVHKAIIWIEQAVAMENPIALNLLGMIHLTGKWMAPDYAKAAQLFTRAEALGSLDAVVNLAQCAVQGLGIEQDVPRALSLLDRAEQQGHALAANLREQWLNEGLAMPASAAPSTPIQQ